MSLFDIAVGMVVALLSDELLGWVDRLSRWLVRQNARHAPKGIADRIEEEWLAHLASIPGKISRLLFAVDCRRAAYMLSHQEHLPHVSPLAPIFLRSLDISLSLLMLVTVLPVIMLVAIAIRVENRGPIFCGLERVGRGGRLFHSLTFCTTHADRSNDGVAGMLETQGRRVTRMGRFLSRSSLDQLPLLLNVLRGEMSLVGPMALRPQNAQKLRDKVPGYDLRNTVRPGLTGFAQVNCCGEATVDPCNWIELDLFFVRNYSVRLVAVVLLDTVRVTVREAKW